MIIHMILYSCKNILLHIVIVAWRTTLYKNNSKAHCPSEGTAESQRPSRSELGCQLGQAIPEKP